VLATIAQELRGRAAELLDQVRGLAVVVEEIGSVAAAFEQSREAHGAARIAAMEQTIAAALDPFSRGGAELAAALARLGPEGSAVGKSLCSSVAKLGDLAETTFALRALHRRLGGIAGRHPACAGDEELRRERLRLFPVGYTMASERAIHAALCGGHTAQAPAVSLEDAVLDALF
jgi:hypothetical protein